MNKRKSGQWDFLINELRPDVALLQESSPLESFVNQGHVASIDIKRSIKNSIYVPSLDYELIKMPKELSKAFVCCKVRLENSANMFFMSIYGDLDFDPFFTVFAGQIALAVTYLKTTLQAEHIILAGDFNADRRMDDNPTGTRFSRRGERVTNLFFDSILNIGFIDCLKIAYPEFVKTHKNNRSSYPWQIDHLFISEGLPLPKIEVLNSNEMNDLSDHYPIIADFPNPSTK